MAKIKWILTCDGDCPEYIKVADCPRKCPQSFFEKYEPKQEKQGG